MGITIVQKSDLSKTRPDARRALVLAGGAISGGAFKLGGLRAFNRYLSNSGVCDFDIYMGISAGAFLAAPIAAGIEPDEIADAMFGQPGRLSAFGPLDFYNPNWREFVGRPMRMLRDFASMGPRMTGRLLKSLPRDLVSLPRHAKAFVAEPGPETAAAVLQPLLRELAEAAQQNHYAYLPSGLFDNSRIETYLRTNLERNGIPNSFRQLKLQKGKSLYIGATNLNTAQGVVFGHDEDNSVSISEAVQASTAIPGFFRPARVGPPGREQDYVDAAVRKTANISTAVRHGAELIICYNPFRPIVNYRHRLVTDARTSIADLGMGVVINQAFRTLLHSRLRLGIEKLRLDDSFKGDVILIEPTETDARFFSMNPLAFWAREAASEHGFNSVKRSLQKHNDTLEKVLGAYGFTVGIDAIGEHSQQSAAASAAKVATPTRSRRPNLRVVGG